MAVRTKNMPERLARSAFELFAQHGIDNVNMDMIAAHANCTKGSLYWHYDTKKDVILAACQLYYQNWHTRIREEVLQVEDPLKKVKKAMRFSVRSCMVDRKNRVFTLGILGMALHDNDIRNSWAKFYDDAREFWISLVEDAKQSGCVHVQNSRRAVDLMLVAFEGIKLRSAIEQNFSVSLEEKAIFDEMMQLLNCCEYDKGN